MPARKRSLLALTLTAGLLCGLSPAAAQVTDWKKIVNPPLRPFEPQLPKRVALDNGLVVFLQEDHELPLVRGWLRIRGGSREEPAGKLGLVQLYGQAWRTGGTRQRSGDELDDYLEQRAAKVESAGGLTATTVSFDCLKDNLDEVFPIFVELLKEPGFREDKLALAKRQLQTQIARRNDQPAGIAFREARKLGYGAQSPYARHPEYATVAAVGRDDLVDWHRRYVHPNNMILGLVGDFDATSMEARIREAFGDWPQGPAIKPAAAPPQGAAAGFYLVEKDDVNQSNIQMVHLGTRKDNPDYYALEVLNEVFGGGFSARLFSSIRTKQGLAYFVRGRVGTAFDHPGLFSISMATKSETTAAAVDALFEEIDGLFTKPPTAAELQRAKDSILNSFIFNFDTRAEVLQEQMAYEFHGYPADFLARYRRGIEKVTVQDVARVAGQYVHKKDLAVLVVGKPADFDRPLESFGAVTRIDIAIPEPESAKP